MYFTYFKTMLERLAQQASNLVNSGYIIIFKYSMRLVHSDAYALLAPNREQHYEAERLSGIKCLQSFKMHSFDFNA